MLRRLLTRIVLPLGGMALAWIVGSNLYDTCQRSYQDTSMVRIRKIGAAIQAFRAAHGAYPRSLQVHVQQIIPAIQEYADEPLSPLDGWGRPLQYVSSGAHYAVWSWGRNAQRDIFPRGGPHEGYDVDLVFSADEFWQGKAGVCCYSGTDDPFEQIERDDSE
jgi:hypothetical protein